MKLWSTAKFPRVTCTVATICQAMSIGPSLALTAKALCLVIGVPYNVVMYNSNGSTRVNEKFSWYTIN